MTKMLTLNNPILRTLKSTETNNLSKDNQYLNYAPTTPPNWKQILRWQFTYKPQKTLNRFSRYRPLRVENPQIFNPALDKIVWLGHASFLITLNGKNILIDPIFKSLPLIKRRVKIPFSLADYQSIDYILISHDHFDHLDKKTLCALTKLNPQAKIYCGLNHLKLFHSWKYS